MGMGRPPGGGGPEGGPDALAVMMRALNLTAAQKTQVQPVLDAATPQIKAIREEAAAKTNSVVQGAEEQIKPVLTPYQRQVLASMDKSRQAQAMNPQMAPR